MTRIPSNIKHLTIRKIIRMSVKDLDKLGNSPQRHLLEDWQIAWINLRLEELKAYFRYRRANIGEVERVSAS